MYLAVKQIRSRIKDIAEEVQSLNVSDEIKAAFKDWTDNMDNAAGSKKATLTLLPLLQAYNGNEKVKELFEEVLDEKNS